MVKKGRNPAAEPTVATPVPSRDSLQRLSFLYQASSALAEASRQQHWNKRRRLDSAPPAPHARVRSPSHQPSAPPPSRRPHAAHPPRLSAATRTAAPSFSAAPMPSPHRSRPGSCGDTLGLLAGHLARQMSEVAKKATVRMDPGVKRTVCQGCGTVLVPGVSAGVRVKPSRPHAHLVAHRCLSCRSERRLPAPPHLSDPPRPELNVTVSDPVARAPAPRRLSKRERREARQARAPVFFEREGHVVVRGSEVVVRDDVQ